MDWFLYNRDLRQESVNSRILPRDGLKRVRSSGQARIKTNIFFVPFFN